MFIFDFPFLKKSYHNYKRNKKNVQYFFCCACGKQLTDHTHLVRITSNDTHMKKKKLAKKILEFKKVSYSFGDHVVLDNVSFTIREGEYWGIVGPNGAGKTTLLKILLGLDSPNSGTFSVFGKDSKAFKNKGLIGYVPQRISQSIFTFPVSVYELVSTGRLQGKLFGFLSREDKQIIDDALGLLGLSQLRNKPLKFLSGGQRQRVFLARALVMQPRLLILDEPSVGVDVAVQETFYSALRDLHTKKNVSIILVSHDLDVVTSEVDNVICLNKKLMCSTPIKEFMKGDYITELYGDNYKLVKHHHH